MSAEPSEITAPPGFDDGTAFAPEVTPESETPETPEMPEPTPDPTPVVVPAQPAGQSVASIDDAIQQRDGIYRDLKGERERSARLAEENARLKGQLEGIQMEQRRGPAQPTPLSPEVTAKATAWAHRWGLYTPDGQPDIQAAANALDELKRDFSGEVDARVNARVQPVVQVLQQAHAASRVSEIVRIGSEFGADPAMLTTYANNLAALQPESLNDPNVIAGLIALTRGMSAVATPTTTPTKPAVTTPTTIPAPNLTEAPGRRVSVAPALSGIERQIAIKRGKSNEDWAGLSKQFENMDPTRGLLVEKD